MRVARPVVLSNEQRDMLESRARARSAAARSVERARIVLLAAGGMQDKQIAAKLRIMPEKAARWRNRFLDGGLAALDKQFRWRMISASFYKPRRQSTRMLCVIP